MTSAIALASCEQLLPTGDPEDQILLAALAERGLAAEVRSWTDPDVDWSSYQATVIRSTWDYTVRRAEFLAWADTVPRLHNRAEVLRGNSDKRYLAELGAAGLPVVPSGFFAPGEPVRLPVGTEFVVKPSVGAGSIGAGRFGPDEHQPARRHAAMLHEQGRTVLVQPYLAEVDEHGETALIFFDGRFSHAAAKSALLTPDARHRMDASELYLTETITPRIASPAERELAERVLAELPPDLLFARIDLLPSPDGPRLLEVELIEPSLFLAQADGAPDRLATAIADRVAAGRPG